jgi:aldehyde dehydrogenase (NAD+)
MADADLDLATDGILWSAFGTTGQRCTAASRVIVERRGRAAARALSRAAASGRPGPTSVDVGPLINPRRRQGRGYVEIGRARASS